MLTGEKEVTGDFFQKKFEQKECKKVAEKLEP